MPGMPKSPVMGNKRVGGSLEAAWSLSCPATTSDVTAWGWATTAGLEELMHCVCCSRVPLCCSRVPLGCKGSCAECVTTTDDDTPPPRGHVCTTVLDRGLGAWSGVEPPAMPEQQAGLPIECPQWGLETKGEGLRSENANCQLSSGRWQPGSAYERVRQWPTLCTSNGVALAKPPEKQTGWYSKHVFTMQWSKVDAARWAAHTELGAPAGDIFNAIANKAAAANRDWPRGGHAWAQDAIVLAANAKLDTLRVGHMRLAHRGPPCYRQ